MIKGIAPGLPSRVSTEAVRTPADRIGITAPAAARAPESALQVATEVTRIVAEGPPVSAERVAALRAAVLAGTYKVEPEQLAERMVASLGPAFTK